jgi:hypothetical protein
MQPERLNREELDTCPYLMPQKWNLFNLLLLVVGMARNLHSPQAMDPSHLLVMVLSLLQATSQNKKINQT